MSLRNLFQGYTITDKREFLEAREVLRTSPRTRRYNPHRYCQHCGSGRTEFRVTTRDVRCKDCRGITTIPGRF
jgi:hypothetical protein